MNSVAILFAVGVVISWGLYSYILRTGSEHFVDHSVSKDVTSARMKAFLLVGIAYFVVAIVGPLLILKMRGAAWDFPKAGWTWSFGAGLAGAVGAFFIAHWTLFNSIHSPGAGHPLSPIASL